MSSKGQMNQEEMQIQSALSAFMGTSRFGSSVPDSGHLDEDVLSAFVEGNMTELEAGPVVSHLADCSFCLHVSAELIKLEAAFADQTPVIKAVPDEAKGIGEVLAGILSRIFGSNDGAVFAHEEKDDDKESDEEQ